MAKNILQKLFLSFIKSSFAETTRGNLCDWVWNIVFWNIFWKELVVNSGYTRIAVCTIVILLEKVPSVTVFEKSLNFYSQLFPFVEISSYVLKNQIKWKITCHSRAKPRRFELIAPKYETSSRKDVQKQNINT